MAKPNLPNFRIFFLEPHQPAVGPWIHCSTDPNTKIRAIAYHIPQGLDIAVTRSHGGAIYQYASLPKKQPI